MTKRQLIERLKEFNDNDEIIAEFVMADREWCCDLESFRFTTVVRGNINDYERGINGKRRYVNHR